MIKQHNGRFFIISGGPGVGKTTLLNYLSLHKGYKYMPEVARAIIADEIANKGDALPWANKLLYLEKMYEAEIIRYREASAIEAATIFFDRSIIDVMAYGRLIHAEVSATMEQMLRTLQHEQPVFVLPPWPEIYTTDNERKQNWDEAVETYGVLKQTYIDFGYRILEVPTGAVEVRAHFVLANI